MLYRIRDWESLFETCETKKLVHLRWVPVPNKHDGKSFRRIAALKNGGDVLAAWILILQIASKCHPRGTLIDGDNPITSEDMALMTGFPQRLFEESMKILSNGKIDWLEVVDSQSSPAIPGDPPAIPVESAAEGRKEGNEKKGRKCDFFDSLNFKQPLNTEAFKVEFKVWVEYRLKLKTPKTPWKDFFDAQIVFLSEHGLDSAISAMKLSRANGWEGLFPKHSKPVPDSKPAPVFNRSAVERMKHE